jgi:hypothetical protein
LILLMCNFCSRTLLCVVEEWKTLPILDHPFICNTFILLLLLSRNYLALN